MKRLRGSRSFLCAATLLLVTLPQRSDAQDLAGIVARAREQVENGKYDEAVRVLALLRGKTLPPQLATEAALLETSALLVTQGAPQAAKACERAVVASGFDPEVAKTQSPKIREVCTTAAEEVRGNRLRDDKVIVGELEAKSPDVAFQPVRVSATVSSPPEYLKLIARIDGSELEGSFDVPLIPSKEGPHFGTLDASWLRPGSKLTVTLVPQDRHGDLGKGVSKKVLDVPKAEAAIALGKIPAGATVEVDGDTKKPDAGGRVFAEPGKREVSLTLADGSSAETTVERKRGVVTRVALAPTQQEPSRAPAWIATGSAFALAVAGGVLLINAEARRSELEDAAAEREPGTDLPANEFSELQAIDDERALFQNIGIGILAGSGQMASERLDRFDGERTVHLSLRRTGRARPARRVLRPERGWAGRFGRRFGLRSG